MQKKTILAIIGSVFIVFGIMLSIRISISAQYTAEFETYNAQYEIDELRSKIKNIEWKLER